MWYKLENRHFRPLPSDYLLNNPANKNDPDYIWFKNYFSDVKKKRIAFDTLNEDRSIYVSTVFLGLDHSFSEHDGPVLFETMVFGFPAEDQERSRTWQESYSTHIRMVERSIHKIINESSPWSPHSLSHFIHKKEIRLCGDFPPTIDFNISRLVVDDGENQPPISFGLFNNIFYKRILTNPDFFEYSVEWWEINDPKCDILKEVEPYMSYLKKPED